MKIENQVCRNVVGFEGMYVVSSLGNIYSLPRNGAKPGLMKVWSSRGYDKVYLSKNGRSNSYAVHRIVAFAFIPNPLNMPLVNHKDGNKRNNIVENLEWCDYKMNALHATKILGRCVGSLNGRAKLTQREVDFMRYMKLHFPNISIASIARFYNMSETAIADIFKFKNWDHLTTPEEVNQRLSN